MRNENDVEDLKGGQDGGGPRGHGQDARATVLSLDFLLDEPGEARCVELCGVSYELSRTDLLEDFLRLIAMTERMSEIVNIEADKMDPAVLSAKLEEARAELRRMIRVLAPGISEEILTDKFPKIGQLQQVFSLLMMEVRKGMPESVKKNSASGANSGATETMTDPESGKVIS